MLSDTADILRSVPQRSEQCQMMVEDSPQSMADGELIYQRMIRCHKWRQITELIYEMRSSLTLEPVEMLIAMREVKETSARTFKYAGWGQLLQNFREEQLSDESISEFSEDVTRKPSVCTRCNLSLSSTDEIHKTLIKQEVNNDSDFTDINFKEAEESSQARKQSQIKVGWKTTSHCDQETDATNIITGEVSHHPQEILGQADRRLQKFIMKAQVLNSLPDTSKFTAQSPVTVLNPVTGCSGEIVMSDNGLDMCEDEDQDDAKDCDWISPDYITSYSHNGQSKNDISCSIDDKDSTPHIEPSRRRSYTIKQKLDTLDTLTAMGGNINKCAQLVGVPRSVLQRWRKQHQHLSAANQSKLINSNKMSRLHRGKVPEHPVIEKKLSNWIRGRRMRGESVHPKVISREALKLHHEECPGDLSFKASHGWCRGFLKRHSLLTKLATSPGQQIPSNAQDLAINFMQCCQNRITRDSLTLQSVGNMDEISVHFDLPGNSPVDFKDIPSVNIKTNRVQHLRFTVVLSALASGDKLKPMIIFRDLAEVPQDVFPAGVHVTVAKGGAMTPSLLLYQWLPHVWQTRLCDKPRLLIWDRHPCHTDTTVTASLHQHHSTVTEVIPTGMSPLLQPLDIYINKSFKKCLCDKWEDWLADSASEFIRTGTKLSASYVELARWVEEVWNDISKDVIVKSFEECGIVGEQELHSHLLQLVQHGVIPDPEALEPLDGYDSD